MCIYGLMVPFLLIFTHPLRGLNLHFLRGGINMELMSVNMRGAVWNTCVNCTSL
jgi:hypothetical protein